MTTFLLTLALWACAPHTPTPPEAPAMTQQQTHPWLPVPQHTVEAAGTPLAVFDTGGDGPVVLLVHGLGATASFWQHQLTGTLPSTYRVVAVDLPGWGRSGQPDGPYTPSWYAEHLIGVLDALEVPSAHVVGHSMGGQAAIALALSAPERIDRLVLAAPAGIETFTPEESAFLGSFWTEERLRDRTPEQARQAFGLVFSRWDDNTQKLLDERLAVDGTDRFSGLARAVMRSVSGMLDEPVADRLGEISVPTLYVYGSADAMIPNPALHAGVTQADIAAKAEAAIPDLTVVRIDGAGHTPQHDDPQAFDAAVSAFLAQ